MVQDHGIHAVVHCKIQNLPLDRRYNDQLRQQGDGHRRGWEKKGVTANERELNEEGKQRGGLRAGENYSEIFHIWSIGNQHSTLGVIITLSNHFDGDNSNNHTCSLVILESCSCPA